MSDYTIEKNVPMPGRKRGLTNALRQMDVGDSTMIDETQRRSVYACASAAGVKVTTQKQPTGDWRVWRTQ